MSARDDLFDQVEEAIIEVRDAYPRRPDDASSADVALAVLKVVNAHEKAVRERIARDIRIAAAKAHVMLYPNEYPVQAVPKAELLSLADRIENGDRA